MISHLPLIGVSVVVAIGGSVDLVNSVVGMKVVVLSHRRLGGTKKLTWDLLGYFICWLIFIHCRILSGVIRKKLRLLGCG